MSEVKRLPDADGWWWCKGMESPVEVASMMYKRGGAWWDCRPGQWLPCPAPDWPPEPPPRPKMVWASVGGRQPEWWGEVECEVAYDVWGDMCTLWVAWYTGGTTWVPASELTPHDHPEQSAEESRRILDAENNS